MSTIRTVPLHGWTATEAMADAVRARDSFKISTGNLSGRPVRPGWPGDLDRLSDAGLPTALMETVYRADYVIRSYATPIAWRADGEWFIPHHGYSSTTAKHQGRVRGIPDALGEPVREMPHRYRVSVRVPGQRKHHVIHVRACGEGAALIAACEAERCPARSVTSVRLAD